MVFLAGEGCLALLPPSWPACPLSSGIIIVIASLICLSDPGRRKKARDEDQTLMGWASG
jgi:small neutral amino acid transporter SnatA (MarC family)